MRSRLRRFLMLSVALDQPKKNSLPVFLVGGIPRSMHRTQCADFDYKKFDSPFGLPQDDSKDGYGFKYILLEEYILNEHKRHESQ
jgi:hypothetical protein